LAAREIDGLSALRLAAAIAVALLLGGCVALPPKPAAPASHALAHTADTRLGRSIAPVVLQHPGLSGVVALADGREAFAVRALLAAAAQRSIDIQTYIWHADATGTMLFDAVLRAADRGVRVRLLLDDNNTVGMDPLLALLAGHANVELRLFNPFAQRDLRLAGYLSDFSRLNRRMHNKSFTVDNQVAVLGGRNIGDEYFDAAQEASFADLDLVMVGAVVPQVSSAFDLYWNSASAYPGAELLRDTPPMTAAAFDDAVRRVVDDPDVRQYRDALAATPLVESMLSGVLPWEWDRVRLIFDDPAKVLEPPDREDLQVLPRLEQAMGLPRAELELVSPYFVPGAKGTAALVALAGRGVRVRVLTNSLAATDVGAVHSGYAKRREALLRGGVQLYELRPQAGAVRQGSAHHGSSGRASLHAKTFALDGQRIFVGSFNLDPRSASLNTEMGVVVDSAALATRLGKALDRVYPADAYEVRLDAQGALQWLDGSGTPLHVEPQTSWARRAGVALMSWLPIEWLL